MRRVKPRRDLAGRVIIARCGGHRCNEGVARACRVTQAGLKNRCVEHNARSPVSVLRSAGTTESVEESRAHAGNQRVRNCQQNPCTACLQPIPQSYLFVATKSMYLITQ